MLGLGRTSRRLPWLSAVLFGMGYMVVGAPVPIWAAQVAADRTGDGFTIALVASAVTSISAPPAMGALLPVLGLPTMLVLVAPVVAAVVAADASTLTVPSRRPAVGRLAR